MVVRCLFGACMVVEEQNKNNPSIPSIAMVKLAILSYKNSVLLIQFESNL